MKETDSRGAIMKLKKRMVHRLATNIIKKMRRSRLKNLDFTIISNNCWGGVISEYFNIRKNSPTVGLYFFAQDYIKFVYNLKWYLAQPLVIIPTKDSKYYKTLVEKNEDNDIIGKLGDIELIFLHYKTPEEAITKWNRRCKRINWNHLFIKFSEMNLCTERELKLFDELPFSNKVMFTKLPRKDLKSAIYYPGYENYEQIAFDTKPFNKCMDIIKFLNQPDCKYNVTAPQELFPSSLQY